MHECNPTDYLTIEAHNDHCEGMKRWADSVVKSSEEDRHKLWDEVKDIDRKVTDMEKLIPKFQWWFIGILVAIIISSYVMPRLTANGTHNTLKDLNTKISIVVDKQAAFDSLLNEVREDQKRRQSKER